MTSVLFYIIAVLILFTALQMVFTKNIVHSILFMVATFIGIAFIYVLLQADYLAIVQILVYVGAVSVLFVFGVMLTRRDNMDVSSPFNRYKAFAAIVVLALLALFGRTILMTSFIIPSIAAPGSTIELIADLLLKDYMVAFEAAGVLLLAAMVGAIILGRGVNNKE